MTDLVYEEKEQAMKIRNWIENALNKQIASFLVCVGSKGGRKIYAITFADGVEADYFIDFEKQTIEEY